MHARLGSKCIVHRKLIRGQGGVMGSSLMFFFFLASCILVTFAI